MSFKNYEGKKDINLSFKPDPEPTSQCPWFGFFFVLEGAGNREQG